MDDPLESLIPLSQAAEFCPPRRKGKRPHRTTLVRWARDGLRGERLEVTMVGATLCTSRGALERFFERLTEKAFDVETVDTPRPRPSSEDIENQLDAWGL